MVVEAWRQCVDSSLAIISYQRFYNPQVVKEPAPLQENLYYWLCKKDTLWSALTICQRIKYLRQATSDGQHPEQQMSGHDEQTLVTKVEQTVHYLITRMGRGKADDLKDIIFLSLALKWVQLPESAPGRTYELHATTRKTMAACMEQLQTTKLTSGCHQRQRSDAEPLAKRIRTFGTGISPNTTGTYPIALRQTTSPLPEAHELGGFVEGAEQWLNDVTGQVADFTDYQADFYSFNGAFVGAMSQYWNWEHLWQ